MDYIYPRPLTKGDTIGLITPSSPLMEGRLEAGVQYFEKKGFKVKLGRHNTKCERFLAGSDEDRADDVMHFFNRTALLCDVKSSSNKAFSCLLSFLTIGSQVIQLSGFCICIYVLVLVFCVCYRCVSLVCLCISLSVVSVFMMPRMFMVPSRPFPVECFSDQKAASRFQCMQCSRVPFAENARVCSSCRCYLCRFLDGVHFIYIL